MEQTPADARAAPSASAPNDIDMGIPSSPKRPRDPAQDNKVSQRATLIAPAMLESQIMTTRGSRARKMSISVFSWLSSWLSAVYLARARAATAA
eukprot:scaffold27710_cov140-Isochrysis_galbana.AAC.2